MPNLVWTPPDGESRTYELILEDLLWAEVRAIQKVTGASGLLEIGERLEAADGGIIPALLWVLRKREGEPTLTFKDLDSLKIRDVTMEGDDEPKSDEEAEPSQTPQTSPPPVEPPPPVEESPSPQSQPMRLAT